MIQEREATPPPPPLRHLRELHEVLRALFRDPIGTFRLPLSLSWPAILSLLVGEALVSGSILGILNRSIWDFLAGLFILPIATLVVSGVLTGFLFYFFSLFHATYLDFRRLASIVSLALLPYFILHMLSGFLPPIDLIGFGVASVFLVVGLVEQFGLERRSVIRIMMGVAFLFFIAWCVSQYRASLHAKSEELVPKSLDDLEHDVHH